MSCAVCKVGPEAAGAPNCFIGRRALNASALRATRSLRGADRASQARCGRPERGSVFWLLDRNESESGRAVERSG